MKAGRSVLLVVALMILAASCGDGGPSSFSPSKDWLVQFKRVTLADDAPDRLEIEIVVRSGDHFAEPAPDGTKVAVQTTVSEFEGNGPRIEVSTVGGHAVVRLVLHPGPALMKVSAQVESVEAELSIVVDEFGSMRIGST
jgi:hypothetical protein